MNKIIFFVIGGLLIIIFGFGIYRWLFAVNPNDTQPVMEEPPANVNKINTLPLAQRPYIALVPHSNPSGCDGVDLVVKNLKNGEKKLEAEIEYVTEKKIEGITVHREFPDDNAKHLPIEFGTCSKGRCLCHDQIKGGSLTLYFEGEQDYALKGDFTVENVGDKEGKLTSRDVRLNLDVQNILSKDTDVLIMNTFGLPEDLSDKVLVGPYGVFIEAMDKLKGPITYTLQSKDVVWGQLQFYNGNRWTILDPKIDGETAKFETDELGVVILTE